MRLPPNYLLYVGSSLLHKNMSFLIHLAAKILHEYDEFYFIKAGAPFTDEQLQLIQKLGISSRVISLGFVPHEKLPAIYSGATLYLQPSITEGFGLPIVEAMSCGALVVAADTPLFRELFNNGAEFMDISDISKSARHIVQLLRKKTLFSSYKKRAVYAVKRYHPKIASEKLAHHYEHIWEEAHKQIRGKSLFSYVRFSFNQIR